MKHLCAFQLLKMVGPEEFHVPVWKPLMDVYRTESGWLLKFELAGVQMRDVKLEVEGRTVRLSGIRRDTVCGRMREHYAMEIAYSRFERSVELPCNVSEARVNSKISDGMLLVQIETL